MNPQTFTISPLGAAIVEAMPDGKLMRKIQRAFNRSHLCPTSQIFPTKKAVEDFYKGERIIACESEVQP
jgi:hypothetical protein